MTVWLLCKAHMLPLVAKVIRHSAVNDSWLPKVQATSAVNDSWLQKVQATSAVNDSLVAKGTSHICSQ
jgi:hypothetical protein